MTPRSLLISITASIAMAIGAKTPEEVAVFITIGQSNADGSAYFDPDEDARLRQWYDSPANPHNAHIWYRSCKVQNQESNALGERSRWVIDGDTTDVAPGWLDLWYRNENTLGRTAMNMIHGYGTYSTGSGTDCAQGRRGMEGEMGMRFSMNLPDTELYVIKLGASGSHISAWANPADNTNWTYFYNNVYRPAMDSLLAQGKRPRLAGIWWMQGCADKNRDSDYYGRWLGTLIDKCRNDLGFADATFYIGHIIGPGTSELYPEGSVEYSENVRRAQDSIAAAMPRVHIINTDSCELQYEEAFKGYIHFSHKGVNTIGRILAEKITADPAGWAAFSTPGYWDIAGSSPVFVPSAGNPTITYGKTADGIITATLCYPGWSETKYLAPGKQQANSQQPIHEATN